MARRRRRTAEKAQEIRTEAAALDPLRDFDGSKGEYYVARFFQFLRDNLRNTLIIIGLTVVVVFGGASFWAWSNEKAREGLVEYENMVKEPIFKTGPTAGKAAMERAIVKLNKYQEKYGDSGAQNRADLKKIELHSALGQKKKAAELALRIASGLNYPDQRAYFFLRAGILYEDSGEFTRAQEAYGRASALITADNYSKAVAMFGNGRCLIKMGKTSEGRKVLSKMMAMKGNIYRLNELRAAATAFLLSQK